MTKKQYEYITDILFLINVRLDQQEKRMEEILKIFKNMAETQARLEVKP